MTQIASRIPYLLVLFLAVLLHEARAQQDSPYFPETGPKAIHQRTLELSEPSVVLYLALQPGLEDLPLVAHLRLILGARVVLVYAGNGETLPGDAGGSIPAEIAAQRKEEAFRVSRFLGATPYYLNLPDPGILSREEDLRRIWVGDTVVARLDHAIRTFKPDVVLVGRDHCSEAAFSLRQGVLGDFVLKAVESAGKATVNADSASLLPWKVARVFSATRRGGMQVDAGYDTVPPAWKVSCRNIAKQSATEYQSLRYQIAVPLKQDDLLYMLLSPHGGRTPRSLLAGLPAYGTISRGFRPMIDRLLQPRAGKMYVPVLSAVVGAIDSLDFLLARNRGAIPSPDLRILAHWKNTLEALRCAILGVKVEYAVDSLLTASQIVYLNFGKVTPNVDSARTRIFFPGAVKHEWGVNLTLNSQFPFSADRQFSLISPSSLPFTLPVTATASTQSSLRTRFSFIVIHRDPVRTHDFIYRGEVPFRTGPRRTLEMLTPVVRAIDGEPVIVRMMNISRDTYGGTMQIEDSSVVSPAREVVLQNKNSVLIDTIRLSLHAPLSAGDHPMRLTLSGGGGLSFVARAFDATTDRNAHVGLLSALEDGPVISALNRLRIDWSKIDTSWTGKSSLDRFNVILMDRDALPGIRWTKEKSVALSSWVQEGGSLVVLPPESFRGTDMKVTGVTYNNCDALPPSSPLVVTDSLALSPNRLTEDDWNGWVVARSHCTIVQDPGGADHVVVKSPVDGKVLVSMRAQGEGRIIGVALDLTSQLMNVHPGAHRLLSNLLCPVQRPPGSEH